jgi:hypothetical protein
MTRGDKPTHGARTPPRARGMSASAFCLRAAVVIAILAGCASSQAVLVGRARPAISPDQVRIYLQPPACPYEQIANLAASSRGSFAITAAGKMDKVVERLKQQAAKLGANGILLHGVADQAGSPVGAAVDIENESTHSPYGLGVSAWAFFYSKAGDGVAIYVAPAKMSPDKSAH